MMIKLSSFALIFLAMIGSSSADCTCSGNAVTCGDDSFNADGTTPVEIDDSIKVMENEVCTLVSVTVNGNIEVKEGASLTLNETFVIDGEIKADKAIKVFMDCASSDDCQVTKKIEVKDATDAIVRVRGITVSDNIVVEKVSLDSLKISNNNITKDGKIVVKEVTADANIHIIGNKMEDEDIHIDDVDVPVLKINNNEGAKHITVRESTCGDMVDIENNVLTDDLRIAENVITGILTVANNTDAKKLEVKNNGLGDMVKIMENVVSEDLGIIDNAITVDLLVQNNKGNRKLEVKKNSFLLGLISSNDFQDEIKVEENTFESSLVIDDNCSGDKVTAKKLEGVTLQCSSNNLGGIGEACEGVTFDLGDEGVYVDDNIIDTPPTGTDQCSDE